MDGIHGWTKSARVRPAAYLQLFTQAHGGGTSRGSPSLCDPHALIGHMDRGSSDGTTPLTLQGPTYLGWGFFSVNFCTVNFSAIACTIYTAILMYCSILSF